MSNASILELIANEVDKRVAARTAGLPKPPSDVRIVIGHRGWVWVGYYSATETEVTLTNARCIRRWGTTLGLAELANGPLVNTKLDASATQRMHPLAVVGMTDVSEEKWRDHLGS